MKSCVLVVLLAMCPVILYSQAQVGLRLGGNFAIWNSSEAEDLLGAEFETLTAGHIGPYVKIPISDNLALEPALLASLKGTNIKLFETEILGEDVITVDSDSDIYLLYLDMPVLLRFYLVDGLNIFAGPQVSFLLNNIIETEYEECFNGTCFTDDEEDEADVKDIDFAVSLGIGYEFPFGLNFNVGYDLGLANIDDSGIAEVNNRVFKASLGWTFGVNRN